MKYNKGDRVTVILDEAAAEVLNIPGRAADLFSRDIISRTPAPFDWDSVKPGMAWFRQDYYYYVGPSPVKAGEHIFTSDSFGLFRFGAEDRAKLTRAPENDKVMK